MSWEYSYLPNYIEKLSTEDPIERIKNFITVIMAGIYVRAHQIKPLNPILGETYQGFIGNETIKVCGEQISHHPPISLIITQCPIMTIYATHIVEANTYPNSIVVKEKGKTRVKFTDSKKTEYVVVTTPKIIANGLMIGKRILNIVDNFTIKDKTNKIYAQIRFTQENKGFFDKIFGKANKERADFFKGLITKNKSLLKDTSRKAFYSKDIISYIEGHWLEEIMIDGEYYWQLGREKSFPVIDDKCHLESDSTNRPDLQALLAGDEAKAQKLKDELEDIQRNDKKLRDNYMKKLNK
jgi:hypothetical protein